jgi:hypothetical protein
VYRRRLRAAAPHLNWFVESAAVAPVFAIIFWGTYAAGANSTTAQVWLPVALSAQVGDRLWLGSSEH